MAGSVAVAVHGAGRSGDGAEALRYRFSASLLLLLLLLVLVILREGKWCALAVADRHRTLPDGHVAAVTVEAATFRIWREPSGC